MAHPIQKCFITLLLLSVPFYAAECGQRPTKPILDMNTWHNEAATPVSSSSGTVAEPIPAAPQPPAGVTKGFSIGYQNLGGFVEYNMEKRHRRWFETAFTVGVGSNFRSKRDGVTDGSGRSYNVITRSPILFYLGPSAYFIVPFGQTSGLSFGAGLYGFLHQTNVTAERAGYSYSGDNAGAGMVFNLPLIRLDLSDNDDDGNGTRLVELNFGVRVGPFQNLEADSRFDSVTVQANPMNGWWVSFFFGRRF